MELETVFTSRLSATLHTRARQGEGIAWLPLILAGEDLASGRLDAGEGKYLLALEVRLVRSLRRQSVTAEAFWKLVTVQVSGDRSPQIAAAGNDVSDDKTG
jgi:DNA-binding transcriptional LysR family regulator